MTQWTLLLPIMLVAFVFWNFHVIVVEAEYATHLAYAQVSCGSTLTVSKADLELLYENFQWLSGSNMATLNWAFDYDPRWRISTCSPNTNFNTSVKLYKTRYITSDAGDVSVRTLVLSAENDLSCSINTEFASLTSEMPNASPLPYTSNIGVYYVDVEGFSNPEDQVEVSFLCGADSGLAEPLCGDCTEIKPPGETGCEIPAVEECVGGYDQFCVTDTWDEVCANTAYTRCTSLCPLAPTAEPTLSPTAAPTAVPASANPSELNCEDCNAQHFGMGCSVPVIEACVCELSPLCCNEWTSKCAALVEGPCSFTCTG